LLSIAFYFAFLCLAIVLISAAFNLTRKYPYRFLTFYLFFLVFFNIHGFMYLVGSSFNVLVFLPREDSIIMALTATTILAAPAQVFYLYFLILWVADLLGKKPSIAFKSAFFFLQIVLIGPVILKLARMIEARNPDVSVPAASWFSMFGGAAFYLAVLVLFWGSRNQPELKKKTLARAIGLFYLVEIPIMVVLTDGVAFPFYKNPTLMLLFLSFINLALNIPPLFYLRWFLKGNPLGTISLPSTDGDLQEFAVRHKLTSREQEIIQLILTGNGTKEIGQRLFISGKTVKNNLSNIFQKTGAKNRIQLVSSVRSRGR
jgi:DNA-binding CsgD family transcriptional regulator